MGQLIVDGMLSTKQFWPTGTADADTATIQIKPTAFYYKSSPSAGRKKLKSFEGAYTQGKYGKTLVIKNGKMSVRLQGIDAPELHYRPTLASKGYTPAQRKRFNDYNEDYRQAYAETSAATLGKFTKGLGAEIPCVAISQVDRPTDVFDVYGRFVGDVRVMKGNKEVNLNHWVLKSGLAIPGIYDSMTKVEIDAVLSAYKKGAPTLDNWYVNKVVKFSAKKVFRRNPTDPRPDAGAKSGSFFHPKLFRRQALHYALSSAKIVNAGFAEYLGTLSDDFLLLASFLEYGKDSDRNPLATMLDGSSLRYAATEVVFTESSSRLLDSKGKFMDSWRFA